MTKIKGLRAGLFAAAVAVNFAVGACRHGSGPAPGITPSAPTTRPADATPGAFCDKEGERGQTGKGTAMVCARAPGESRPRWRAP